jgi:histone H3/H4
MSSTGAVAEDVREKSPRNDNGAGKSSDGEEHQRKERRIMAGNLVVKSEVKRLVKEMDYRLGEEGMNALNSQVEELIKKAAERAKGNNRKTIMAQDI